MRHLQTKILLIALCFSLAGNGVCEEIRVGVLGCKLSSTNLIDITVDGSANISFMYRESTLSPIKLITISKYPGDKAWNTKQSPDNVSSATYKKYGALELKTVVFRKKFPSGTEFQELTDRKVVVFYKGSESDIGKFLDCSK